MAASPRPGLAGSPLNNLSAEIRNKIWWYAVSDGNSCWERSQRETAQYFNLKRVAPVRGNDGCFARSPKDAQQPAITRVCKQIRYECLLMFYASNTFILQLDTYRSAEYNRWLISKAMVWLDRISLDCHSAVRKLRIDLEAHDNPSLCSWVPFLERLKKFLRRACERGYSEGDDRVIIITSSYGRAYPDPAHLKGLGLSGWERSIYSYYE